MKVALVTEVFHGDGRDDRLAARLREARARGAALAVLPELPLDPWVAVSRRPREEDAEAPGGPRASLLARATEAAGVAVLGGAIVRESGTGRRHATALLVDRSGRVVERYRKVHLPDEEGFRETAHYVPGDDPPRLVEVDGFPLGVQVCSDVNRPTGAQLLAASGAAALLVPRATPPETWERWRLVLRALAATGAMWVVSVNRPAEVSSPSGGPSLVVAPDGEVVLETTEPLETVELDLEAVRAARGAYPGYLPFRADVYGRGWRALAAASGEGPLQAG